MAGTKKQKSPHAETEAPTPAPPGSVGETLRSARETRKLEIDTVAKALHIRPAQIKAIEDNNIESLPGMTYAVGFVRSYANYLGLNGADVVHRFKAEQGHDPAQSKLSFPQPVAESRVPDPMMVGVGAFLAVVILVLWTVYSNVHGSAPKTADKIPPAPVVTNVADSLPATTTTSTVATTSAPAVSTTTATAVPLSGAPSTSTPTVTTGTDTAAATTSAPASVPTPVATASTQAAPAAATPTMPEAQTAALAAVAATTTTAPAAMAPVAPAAKKSAKITASDDADAEDDTPDDNNDAASAKKSSKAKNDADDGVIKIKKGKSRVTLTATAPSWIQVEDAHQKVLYRKVLRPGEQYSVPDQPGMILDTANAGALDITVDGKTVKPIGKNGDIMRGVALDPSSLKAPRIRD